MKAIIGLGNKGVEYSRNRHNSGFMFIDHVLCTLPEAVHGREKFKGLTYEILFSGSRLILVKPQTFMNNSGDCVRELANFYKIKPEDILVVHDDLDIKLGSYKLADKKGPHAHNGLMDVENKLGTKDFLRLRIGVENREDIKIPGNKYVLSDFTEDEEKVILKVFVRAWEEVITEFIKGE